MSKKTGNHVHVNVHVLDRTNMCIVQVQVHILYTCHMTNYIYQYIKKQQKVCCDIESI